MRIEEVDMRGAKRDPCNVQIKRSSSGTWSAIRRSDEGGAIWPLTFWYGDSMAELLNTVWVKCGNRYPLYVVQGDRQFLVTDYTNEDFMLMVLSLG